MKPNSKGRTLEILERLESEVKEMAGEEPLFNAVQWKGMPVCARPGQSGNALKGHKKTSKE